MATFKRVRLWGDVPFKLTLPQSANSEDFNPTRSPQASGFTIRLCDLWRLKVHDLSWTELTVEGYPQAAVKSLLAKVYLSHGRKIHVI